MLVAAVQLSTQDDVEKNLARCRHWIAEAARAGARLIALPENFAFMGQKERKRALAETVEDGACGPIVSMLRTAAATHGVHIVAGGMPEKSGDEARPFNTSLLVGPNGIVARYRKIHLFDAHLPDGTEASESEATMAGASGELAIAPVEGVPVGMTVCYDVRFPELFRVLGEGGAHIITVPASFTLATGKDHWHVLLRARAIENQLFVVAPAQTGKHPNGHATYGKSLIVDPWGDVLAQCGEGEGVALARLDFAYLARVRASLPALSHKRVGFSPS